jgi:hypothetical protein
VAVVFPRDQVSMPGQERVGAHDGADLAKCSATQVLRLGRQPNALVVRESQSSRSELLPEHAILGLEIVDYLALLLVDPAGQGDKKKPERMRNRSH